MREELRRNLSRWRLTTNIESQKHYGTMPLDRRKAPHEGINAGRKGVQSKKAQRRKEKHKVTVSQLYCTHHVSKKPKTQLQRARRAPNTVRKHTNRKTYRQQQRQQQAPPRRHPRERKPVNTNATGQNKHPNKNGGKIRSNNNSTLGKIHNENTRTGQYKKKEQTARLSNDGTTSQKPTDATPGPLHEAQNTTPLKIKINHKRPRKKISEKQGHKHTNNGTLTRKGSTYKRH